MNIEYSVQVYFFEDVIVQGRFDFVGLVGGVVDLRLIRYRLGVLEEEEDGQWSWSETNEMGSLGRLGQRVEQVLEFESCRSYRGDFLFVFRYNGILERFLRRGGYVLIYILKSFFWLLGRKKSKKSKMRGCQEVSLVVQKKRLMMRIEDGSSGDREILFDLRYNLKEELIIFVGG